MGGLWLQDESFVVVRHDVNLQEQFVRPSSPLDATKRGRSVRTRRSLTGRRSARRTAYSPDESANTIIVSVKGEVPRL